MSRPSPPEQPDAPRPSPDAERRAEIAEVESEIEELGDPEAGPALPSTTLAAPTRVVDPAAPPAATGTGITREVLRLAWPVMLSGAMVSLVGLVDRAMIGRLGGPDGAALPLAAVGYATQIFFLIQSTIFAIGFACVALVARAIASTMGIVR